MALTTKKSKKFDDIKDEYETLFAACEIKPSRKTLIKETADKIIAKKSRYEAAGAAAGVTPWFVVGIIHLLEGSLDFKTHLHNGDPLSARTVQVPKGRPKGSPPFTWEVSAADAMAIEGFDGFTTWPLTRTLFRLERFNGMGYRPKGNPSPYLWSFSNIYEKGKFTSDGKYDPDAVSKQIGAAVILKHLVNEGEVTF